MVGVEDFLIIGKREGMLHTLFVLFFSFYTYVSLSLSLPSLHFCAFMLRRDQKYIWILWYSVCELCSFIPRTIPSNS